MHGREGERGSTLLDVVVGSALMIVVFVGIVGAFRLAVDVVSNNKARAGAIALANERLEYIRSLSYNSVGTVSGIPSGTIPQSESVALNDVNYTRRTFIDYEDDAGDGTGAADTNHIPEDFKAAKVSVSWTTRQGTRTITMVTRLTPPTGVETSVPGGTISIQAADATGQAVQDAQVRIVNAGVSPAVDLTTYTDTAGNASIVGAPAGAGYQITVSKSGYSSAQTYSASSTNTNPTPAHLGVALNQTTASTFAIDTLGSLNVQSFTPIARATSTEPFSNANVIASSTNITVASGVAQLTSGGGSGYPSAGMLISIPLSTTTMQSWRTFTWVGAQPASTNILFRFYDSSGTSLIPDAQIPGNAAGLSAASIDLSNVSTSTYLALAVHATLTTSNASNTPSIDSWAISNDSGPLSLSNLAFTMQGAKTIGSGPSGPVYKYNQAQSTGAPGSVTISNVEYDSYTLSVASATGYDISSSCSTQPVVVAPSASVTTLLYVSPHTTNSLLVDVKNAAGAAIPNASVHVYRAIAPASNTTILADSCGQSFFTNMASGTSGSGNAYSISVSAAGYTTYTSTTVNVSGTSRLSVILN